MINNEWFGLLGILICFVKVYSVKIFGNNVNLF